MSNYAARLLLDCWEVLREDESVSRIQDFADALQLTRDLFPEVSESYDPSGYIHANAWTFAKTMPQHPHEYLLIHKSTDWREHMRFLRFIVEHGELERYGGLDYFGVVVDGKRYWRMSGRWKANGPAALNPDETIINRRDL
jgi:hypothetical protein